VKRWVCPLPPFHSLTRCLLTWRNASTGLTTGLDPCLTAVLSCPCPCPYHVPNLSLHLYLYLSLQECEALGVAPPAFPQLDEVSADLAATQASWGSYRDFLQERDSMAHKDWLSMRDQVRQPGRICSWACRVSQAFMVVLSPVAGTSCGTGIAWHTRTGSA
jgi:hypothetical protein